MAHCLTLLRSPLCILCGAVAIAVSAAAVTVNAVFGVGTWASAIVCCCKQECGISKAGELSVLSEAAGAFVHVDLKANLLSDWQEVSGCVWSVLSVRPSVCFSVCLPNPPGRVCLFACLFV